MITPLELKFEGKATSFQEVTIVDMKELNEQTDRQTNEQMNRAMNGDHIYLIRPRSPTTLNSE